jgi:hypothetical protein
MSDFDLEAILQEAFKKCDRLGHPLNEEQKWILTQVIREKIIPRVNPLSKLPDDQREALLQFIQAEGQNWKISLLNDWLLNRDSGTVQFVRDSYGMQWLEMITPAHIAEYADNAIKLKVGDRIEVANALWEWVPKDDPESYDWFSGVVVGVSNDRCTIRFENGTEIEMEGIYDWNRSNWRWSQD